MKTISKNKMRKMRKYQSLEYYTYLIQLFLSSEGYYARLVQEIEYSMTNTNLDITGGFIRYSKALNPSFGKEVEMFITSVVGKLATGRTLPDITSYEESDEIEEENKTLYKKTNKM